MVLLSSKYNTNLSNIPKIVLVILIFTFCRGFSRGMWRFLYPIYIRDGVTIQYIGLITSISECLGLLTTLLAGELIDKVGRHKFFIVFIGYIGAVHIWLMGYLRGGISFAVCLTIACISNAMIETITITVIGLSVQGNIKSLSMGFYEAAIGIGALIGPFVGGRLSLVSSSHVFSLSAILLGIAATVCHLFLKVNISHLETGSSNYKSSIKSLLRNRKYVGFILFFFFYDSIGMLVYPGLWALFAEDELGFTSDKIGLMISIEQFGFGTFAFLSGFIASKLGNRKTALYGMFGLVIFTFLFCYSKSGLLFYSSGLLIGCATGLCYGPSYAFISEIVPSNIHGKAIALLTASSSLTALIIPSIGSTLWHYRGPQSPFIVYFFCSLVIIALYASYYKFIELQKTPKTQIDSNRLIVSHHHE